MELMEKGIIKASKTGVPQGGPISVILSNVYLDKLDKLFSHWNDETIYGEVWSVAKE